MTVVSSGETNLHCVDAGTLTGTSACTGAVVGG
jgi:hypothetical protein